MAIRTSADIDLVDFHLGVHLAMAGFAAGVFSAAEFLHDQFRALGDGHDFGRNTGRFQHRLADFQAVVVAKGQNPVESHLIAGRFLAQIDIENLAFFYFDIGVRRLK